MTDKAAYIYRVDKFTVPAAAREEFIGRVQQTHALLKAQPGFRQDFVLENAADGGATQIVTIVEWENAGFVEQAKAAVRAMQQQANFSPQELIARLGITAEIGSYQQIRT